MEISFKIFKHAIGQSARIHTYRQVCPLKLLAQEEHTTWAAMTSLDGATRVVIATIRQSAL